TVSQHFYDGAYQLDRIEFGDGTVWDAAEIAQRVQGGTDGDDLLYAPDGGATLDGGAGNDTLIGGAGDDVLIGGDGDDVLYGGEGNDALHGGAGDDWLDGGAGNDTLHGGAGNDWLRGGEGSDVYLFGRGDGWDTIDNYDTSEGREDVLRLGDGIAADQIWLRRQGYNLEIALLGTEEGIVVSNWFYGGAYQLNALELSNGQRLAGAQVQSLVEAMAAFDPPGAGVTSLPPGYAESLHPVIATSWQ
ncbi:MAG: hypothetical protein KJZ96_14675, partial [Rhodocyclaceae bacterium]|nr:hypothetical protein [Rhodocyclaceae bacterium]